jgi:alpha-L-rhamnosidase
VEWSLANELTGGMNYPTNMLYTAFLKAGAELYGKAELTEKAEKIADVIRTRSFDGNYFRDHDVRNAQGVLEQMIDRTETCQYYAFYFGIATPETYPVLWEKLTTVFGPDRDAKTVEAEIHQANAFIGNYLRLEILRRYGLREKMLGEIEDYFYVMSQRTGTLWEHMNDMHSCDHGFASYVIYLMKE